MKIGLKHKRDKKIRRARRTRSNILGTASRPRLSVFRSLRYISAQVIDDEKGITLVSASDKKIDKTGKKPIEVAEIVGEDIAKKALESGIKKVVFDRGPYLYHGRVKALAESVRKNGLEF